MNFKTVVIGLATLAGVSVVTAGGASAMPNGLPRAGHLPTSTRFAGFVTRGGDNGGGRTSMELTATTGLHASTGARGVGTAAGAVGNDNANLGGLRAPLF
jgi:hypothetical protein